MPEGCDGCGKDGGVRHALACKMAGLISSRYDEIRDELALMASQAFSPTAVRDEPRIPTTGLLKGVEKGEQGSVVEVAKRTAQGSSLERGDIAIRGFWASQITCYVDVRVTDVDAKSHISKPVHKVLAGQEREKRTSI